MVKMGCSRKEREGGGTNDRCERSNQLLQVVVASERERNKLSEGRFVIENMTAVFYRGEKNDLLFQNSSL